MMMNGNVCNVGDSKRLEIGWKYSGLEQVPIKVSNGPLASLQIEGKGHSGMAQSIHSDGTILFPRKPTAVPAGRNFPHWRLAPLPHDMRAARNPGLRLHL
jgi:hypothetical protein